MMLRCPVCGSKSISLRPITIPKGNRNRNGYKTHILCLLERCMWEEYSILSIMEYLNERVGIHLPRGSEEGS
jgi:hypothetical protein